MPAPQPQKFAFLIKALPTLTVAAAIGYAAAVHFLLFFPRIAPLRTGGRLDPGKLHASYDDEVAYEKRLDGSLADFGSFNAEKKLKASAIVPADKDIPGIYVQLDTIARAHEFVVSSVDVVASDAVLSVPGVKTLRIAANLTGGTYAQFKLLLADLEQSTRAFDVQSIVFSPSGGIYGLVIRAYYLDPKSIISPVVPPTKTTGGTAATS